MLPVVDYAVVVRRGQMKLYRLDSISAHLDRLLGLSGSPVLHSGKHAQRRQRANRRECNRAFQVNI